MQGYRAPECRGTGLLSAGRSESAGLRGAESAGVWRHRGPGVPGYNWLSLATIDLVGNNREFEV